MMVAGIIAGFLILGLFFSMISSTPGKSTAQLESLGESSQPDTAV